MYVAASLVQWHDSVKSQAGIGIAGVLLLSITVAAGLGFCALLGMFVIFNSLNFYETYLTKIFNVV